MYPFPSDTWRVLGLREKVNDVIVMDWRRFEMMEKLYSRRYGDADMRARGRPHNKFVD